MSELLAAAAAAMGIPESLVERSAAARATETGSTVDEVLTAWAGGGAVAAAAPAPEPNAPAGEPTEDAEVEEAGAPATGVAAAVGVETEMAQPTATASAAATALAPVPSEVTAAEAANLPVVITVPTAGIRERTNFAMPRWLTAVMLIIPALALLALGGSATGTCGDATELATDVVTGQIVDCDGGEFTGSGAAGGTTDFIAMGDAIYNGTGVSGVNCAGCHGAGGGGIATFPALTGVLTTFGSCSDHLSWVSNGSAGFQAAGESTYGDINKPISGGMPGFSSLSEEQLAAVASFERVRFGGGDPDTVLADCGLGAENGGDEADATDDATDAGAPEASAALSG